MLVSISAAIDVDAAYELQSAKLKTARKVAIKFDVDASIRHSGEHDWRPFMATEQKNSRECRMCRIGFGNRGSAQIFCWVCRRNLCLSCWHLWHEP